MRSTRYIDFFELWETNISKKTNICLLKEKNNEGATPLLELEHHIQEVHQLVREMHIFSW